MYAKRKWRKQKMDKNLHKEKKFTFFFTSRSVLHAGDPTWRSGVALQVGIGERREGGGRAEGREAQTPARGEILFELLEIASCNNYH